MHLKSLNLISDSIADTKRNRDLKSKPLWRLFILFFYLFSLQVLSKESTPTSNQVNDVGKKLEEMSIAPKIVDKIENDKPSVGAHIHSVNNVMSNVANQTSNVVVEASKVVVETSNVVVETSQEKIINSNQVSQSPLKQGTPEAQEDPKLIKGKNTNKFYFNH